MINNDSENDIKNLKNLQQQLEQTIRKYESNLNSNNNPDLKDELQRVENERKRLEEELKNVVKSLETLYFIQQEQSKTILL